MAESISTCRFAQRMAAVAVDARHAVCGLAAAHGSLLKLDPVLQQYLAVRLLRTPKLMHAVLLAALF